MPKIELDDAARKQLSIRCINEEEVQRVVDCPQTKVPKLSRSDRPVRDRYIVRGAPKPGRIIEVEYLIRADNGLYRIIRVTEV